MHIDTEIEEEEEEHIVSSSEDDDMEDETYRISPRAFRGAALDDEDEIMEGDDDVGDELKRQFEEEEKERAEEIANPQQRGRIPFPHKPTI
jgi:hypothetical protein